MSLPLAPRPPAGGELNPPPSPSLQKSKKISTACGACKQRKTRCSGGQPCEACASRNSTCDYDATSDQRRKIANQRNVQDLASAQRALERSNQLLGGMVAIIRVGSPAATNDLFTMIRNEGTDLSSLAAFVRNEVRASLDLQSAFDTLNFDINGLSDLPSPNQILSRLEAQEFRQDSESSGNASGNASGFNTDPSVSR